MPQQRRLGAEQFGVLEIVVTRESPDGDVIAVVADVRHLAQPADVDQH